MTTPTWFAELYRTAESHRLSPQILRHLAENRERIVHTVDFLDAHGLRGKHLCEIGPGGVGVACRQRLGAIVDGYDCSDWSRPLCDAFGIPWNHLDLHQPGLRVDHQYDAVLLCEVIEHIARWPAEVLAELHSVLKPGGLLLVTTQNLHRLSQRVRMCLGRPLFAPYTRESLVMAHLREYTPEELEFLFERAGFARPQSRLLAFSDATKPRLVQAGHNLTCRLFPGLSSFIYCWATK